MRLLRTIAFFMALALDRFPAVRADASLHFVSSPDRQLGFYRAPPTYQRGKSPLSSLIITSKPLNVGREGHRNPFRTGQFSSTTPPTTTAPPSSTTTTTYRPQTNLHIPTYTIDCEADKSCSQTINVESDPNTSTIKPISKELINKLLANFQDTSRERPISSPHIHTPTGYDKSIHENLSNPSFGSSRLPAHLIPDFHVLTGLDYPSHGYPGIPENIEERLSNKVSDWSDNSESESSTPAPDPDKSKAASWSLSKDHHHHYSGSHDQEGWVTLEPIPWSSSKITKWILNRKPASSTEASTWSTYPSRWPTAAVNRPHSDKPPWAKPGAEPWAKPGAEPWAKPGAEPWSKPGTEPWQNNKEPLIITDGKPAGWPAHKPHWSEVETQDRPSHWEPDRNQPPSVVVSRPPSKPFIPESPDNHDEGFNAYPFSKPVINRWTKPWNSVKPDHHDDYNAPPYRKPTPVVYHGIDTDGDSEDGRWVLLSSTKDYMIPHRPKSGSRRGFSYSPKPMSIRLTVLPSANGVNTTTSHGGLLEVENNFDSVDVAGQLADKPQSDEPANTTTTGTRFIARPVVARGNRLSSNSRAVLAALGAGIVPVTMAALIPFMLGRKRRSTVTPPMIPTNLTTVSNNSSLVTYPMKTKEKLYPNMSKVMNKVSLTQSKIMKKMGLPAANTKRRKVIKRKQVKNVNRQEKYM